MLTVLCRRTLGAQPLFLLAVPGAAAPARLAPALPQLAQETPQAALDFAPPPSAPPVVDEIVAPQPPVEAPVVVEAPVAPLRAKPRRSYDSPRRSAGELAADLAERLHGDNVRFLWQTDAAHAFVKITGELCDLVGCMTNRLVGRSFIDIADELGLDPDARLRDPLNKGETWSGLEILWPVENADAAFPITLGALPAYDRNRRFEG